MVSGPTSVTHPKQTPMLEWYVLSVDLRMGAKKMCV